MSEGTGDLFSELNREELGELFSRLGSGWDEASHRNYAVGAEIAEVQADVKQVITDVTHAEFAGRRAQAEPEAAERHARVEAGDPEAYLDFF